MELASSLLRPVLSPVTAVAWPPLVALSRRTILGLLGQIKVGQLVVQDAIHNITTVCGGGMEAETNGAKVEPDVRGGRRKGPPRAILRVQRDAFWVRLLLFADMGFAESFMLGEVLCDDLVAFFEIFINNRTALANATTLFSSLATTAAALARRTNTLANARLNVAAHYDISNAMFAAFLSPDMTYSCPIWRPRSDAAAEGESLEAAQTTKLRRVIELARIRPGHRVLEIGTGWGSFAIEAVRRTGCRVTSLTLSIEQQREAQRRVAAARLDDRIEVRLCDYRHLPTPTTEAERYDRVVSIEMLEAVGAEFLATYFGAVDGALARAGGVAVFQCITIPEPRYAAYAAGTDFIRRYIFPGGHLPTLSGLVRAVDQGSGGRLLVDEVQSIGGHYAKTLRLWRANFADNFEARIAPALRREHPHMDELDVELFRRKWEYYFTYCEAGFRTKTLGDVIITVGREGATDMLSEVPF